MTRSYPVPPFPPPTRLPDTKYFQWSIVVYPHYTTHSIIYLCFHKILLALKPNILLTFKVCIFNPAKTALSHSFPEPFIKMTLTSSQPYLPKMSICQSFPIITIDRLSFFALLKTHSSLSMTLSKNETQNWIQKFSLTFLVKDRTLVHLSCVQ